VVSSRIKLEDALDSLEKDFDGTNGKPKVDRTKILDFIVKNPRTELPLSQIARVIDPEGFARWDIQRLNGGDGGKLPFTEGSGSGVIDPPKVKYTFADGSVERAAADLLKGNATK